MPSLSKAMEMASASLKSHNETFFQTNNLTQNVFIVCVRVFLWIDYMSVSSGHSDDCGWWSRKNTARGK